MVLNVALIGCGALGEIRAEHCYPQLTHLARVVAAVDPRPERAEAFAARLGARAYTDVEQALADPAVQAVDICVPHRLHHQVAMAAARAGKHILVEKPMAVTRAEGEEMIAAARAARVVLAVAENYTFFEPVLRARQLIDAGAIGRLVALRTHRVGYLSGIWLRDGWRQNADLAGGGILLDQGCHYTNILRRLGGEITAVHAMASTGRDDWRGEDTAMVNCRFAAGYIGQQFYCWATRTPELGAEAYVFGSEGSLEVYYIGRGVGLHLYRQDKPGGLEVVLPRADYMESFVPTVEDFLRAALGEKPPAMPGEEGLRDLTVVLAAYRSLASGREEAVEPVAGEAA